MKQETAIRRVEAWVKKQSNPDHYCNLLHVVRNVIPRLYAGGFELSHFEVYKISRLDLWVVEFRAFYGGALTGALVTFDADGEWRIDG